jgi:hypothetical protein
MLCISLLFIGGSRPKRTRYVHPSIGRQKEKQDARIAIAVKKQRLEERKKRVLFANIENLKNL